MFVLESFIKNIFRVFLKKAAHQNGYMIFSSRVSSFNKILYRFNRYILHGALNLNIINIFSQLFFHNIRTSLAKYDLTQIRPISRSDVMDILLFTLYCY